MYVHVCISTISGEFVAFLTHSLFKIICGCHSNHHFLLLKQYSRVTLLSHFIVTHLQVKDLQKGRESHTTVTCQSHVMSCNIHLLP